MVVSGKLLICDMWLPNLFAPQRSGSAHVYKPLKRAEFFLSGFLTAQNVGLDASSDMGWREAGEVWNTVDVM